MKKVTFLLLLVSMLLTGCSSSTTASQKTTSSQETTAKVQKKTTEDKTTSTTATQNISAEELSKWTYNSGDNSVKVLNNDQPNTIKATDFEQAHIDYGGLDNLNRTKTATAYLTRNNLGKIRNTNRADLATNRMAQPT
jgi:MLTD_N.